MDKKYRIIKKIKVKFIINYMSTFNIPTKCGVHLFILK